MVYNSHHINSHLKKLKSVWWFSFL